MNHRDPLESVLKVAASMTQARNALRDSYGPPELASAIARGWVAYAILYIAAARLELKDAGNEFSEMAVDSPEGKLYQAMEKLESIDFCSMGEARGLIAEAHIRFRKFHKALGYREITNDDLAPYQVIGVGGGGGR